MKNIIILLVLIFLNASSIVSQNLLDANMQGVSGAVDIELQRIELINKFELNIIDSNWMLDFSYDFMKIDSLSNVRDKFETTLMTLTLIDKSKYEAAHKKIKNLKYDFDKVKECIAIIRSIDNEEADEKLTLELIEETTRKVDSLKIEQEKVLSEIANIINPVEPNEEELTTVPEIDGLHNNLAPNVKFVASSPRKKIGQIKGALFTGNNLNDEFNPEAFYNEGSSTYGFLTYGHIKFLKYLGFNGNVSLVEKSIKTPTEENAINMHYLNTKVGLEIAASEYVAAFAGYNYGRPIDNLSMAKANINFQADGTGVSQSYFNLGVVIQANLQPGSQDSRLTVEVNNIFLNKDLKETLKRPDDSGLLVIKLSLTKKL